jgi:hypothetical protein
MTFESIGLTNTLLGALTIVSLAILLVIYKIQKK